MVSPHARDENATLRKSSRVRGIREFTDQCGDLGQPLDLRKMSGLRHRPEPRPACCRRSGGHKLHRRCGRSPPRSPGREPACALRGRLTTLTGHDACDHPTHVDIAKPCPAQRHREEDELPIHSPPWQTVRWWFRRLARRLMFRKIHDVALMIDRALADRDTEPTAAIIDSQTIKAPAPGAERGCDGAKKTVGRKRHIAADTAGRLSLVHLTPANISDSAGAQAVLDALHSKWPWIKQLLAGSASDRRQLMDKVAFLHPRHRQTDRACPRCTPPSLGRRANPWVDDPTSAARAGLGGSGRCIGSYDRHRHGWVDDAKNNPPIVVKKALKASSPCTVVLSSAKPGARRSGWPWGRSKPFSARRVSSSIGMFSVVVTAPRPRSARA